MPSDPEEETLEVPSNPEEETLETPLDPDKTLEAPSDLDDKTQEAPLDPEEETREVLSDPGMETNDEAGLAEGPTDLEGPIVPARQKFKKRREGGAPAHDRCSGTFEITRAKKSLEDISTRACTTLPINEARTTPLHVNPNRN